MFKYNDKRCLVNVSNSILKNFGINPFHEGLPSLDALFKQKHYQKITVLLFDGMGSSIQDYHLNNHDFLVKHHFDEITSVFPPTTVAATTAFLSGRYPIETGWIGWSQYFPSIDKRVDMFSNADSTTKQPIKGPHLGKTYYPYESIIDLINNSKKAEALSIYPYGIENGKAVDLNDFFNILQEEMQKDRSHFIYGYWADPDTTIHLNGTTSYKVRSLLKKINRKIIKLSKECKDNLILVLADHSLIDIENCYIDEHLDFYSCLEDNYSIESRCASFRIKPGKDNEFLYLFDKYYSDNFLLLSKDLALSTNLFGKGEPHPLIKDSLGDYIAIAKNSKSFAYPLKLFDYPIIFKATHAGGTSEESLIYLSVINQ